MTLVFKVTEPSSYHGNAMLVAIFKREFILDTSTRLDDGCYAFIAGNFHAVGEREECVTCHYSAIQVETEVFGFLDSLLQSIHTAGLTYTTCNNCFPFASTMAFDLLFFTILFAKSISSISCAVGAFVVTVFNSSGVSTLRSRS